MRNGTYSGPVVRKMVTQRGFIGVGYHGKSRTPHGQKTLSRAIRRVWPTFGCFERCANSYQGAYTAMTHCGLDCIRRSMRKILDLVYQDRLYHDPNVQRLKKSMKQLERTTEEIKQNIYKNANV